MASTAHALEVGQPAPDFKAESTSGKTVSLKDFQGKWLVVYFYPKAFTPGCTKESCQLRDSFSDINKLGAVILGVSLDDIDTQKRFKEKYKLPFDLLSDNDKKMAKAYNTLGLLGLYTSRKTFVINPEGKLAYIFESVKPATHDRDVYEKLKELQGR